MERKLKIRIDNNPKIIKLAAKTESIICCNPTVSPILNFFEKWETVIQIKRNRLAVKRSNSWIRWREKPCLNKRVNRIPRITRRVSKEAMKKRILEVGFKFQVSGCR